MVEKWSWDGWRLLAVAGSKPVMLREGDTIKQALSGTFSPYKRIELNEPWVVPRTGWYMVEIEVPAPTTKGSE